MPSYFLSKLTRSYATPTKPGSLTGASRITLPRTVSTGRKVARPESERFSISMALRPSFCVSMTIFCIDAPSAVSTASAYSLSVLIRLATGPCTPRRFPLPASRMTVLTALEKPSYSFSISASICMRASMLRQSTDRRLTFSLSAAAAFSRLCSFMRQPSMTLSLLLCLRSSSAIVSERLFAFSLFSFICFSISSRRL